MGTVADSLFTVLMSWVRALVSGLWALVSAERTTILAFLGKNWLILAAAIIAAGLVIDWLIWLLRWQPYHLWAQRARRLMGIEEEEEEEGETMGRAQPAVSPARKKAPVYAQKQEPAAQAALDEADERQAMDRASSVPDADLGAYPGMKYDSEHAYAPRVTDGTQRYSALTNEGPGAAEVARRKAEIEAYRRMQQEAEQRAREEAAYRAEQARIAQQEAARRAEEEAARRAQEEYERQLAQYEIDKAKYEQEMAQYRLQMAQYEAQMAADAAQDTASAEQEPALQAAASPARRRRQQAANPPAAQQAEQKADKAEKGSGLLGRVAQMIEPQEEEIVSFRSLPPRVDPRDAYMPAKAPQKDRRRNR